MKGRLVAIDFGMKRIGLAISDETKKIAFPHKTLQAGKTGKETLDILLAELVEMERARGCEIGLLIVGLPLHLSGKESPLSQEVRYFSEQLRARSGKGVELSDERFTSSRANLLLKESGKNRKDRTKEVDALSASLLLEDFLHSRHGL